MEITLDSGKKVNVRKLGIFELDSLRPESVGVFTYEIEIMGVKYDAEFDINKIEVPPQKPETPEGEITKGSKEYDQLVDWKLYQAALLHEKRRQETIAHFYEAVTSYILNNCIDHSEYIKTEHDWNTVYDHALTEPLTIDKIAEVLDKTYGAKFNGVPVLKALEGTQRGSGVYDSVRLWENKLMVEMQMTELEYSLLSLDERARKVCVLFLDDIMSYLEMDLMKKNDKKTS